MRHLELFAGIGGFRRAMDLLTQDHIMDFHCIGYSEIDAKAVKTYCANYHPEVDGELAMGDIVEFTSNKDNIDNLPQFDLVTGGSPPAVVPGCRLWCCVPEESWRSCV